MLRIYFLRLLENALYSERGFAKFSISLLWFTKILHQKISTSQLQIPKNMEKFHFLFAAYCAIFFKVALLITHSIFIALAGKKKCRPHLLRVNEGVKKCTMRQGPGGDYRRGFSLQEFTFFMRRPKRGDLVLLCHCTAINCSNSSIKLHFEVG